MECRLRRRGFIKVRFYQGGVRICETCAVLVDLAISVDIEALEQRSIHLSVQNLVTVFFLKQTTKETTTKACKLQKSDQRHEKIENPFLFNEEVCHVPNEPCER